MAATLKNLGQANPGAVLTALYTVPGATSTEVSVVVVCNQAGVAATFRLSVAVAGAADAVKQYLYFDVNIPANDTLVCVLDIVLATTDILRCYGSATTVSFNAFGVELT